MTKKRKPFDPRYPINRRSFLMSLCATGLAARPSGLAARSLDIRRSAEMIENLFDRYFFDPTWIATTEAHALFADLALLADVASDPEAFCRDFGKRFESIGLSHVGLSVQSRSAVQLGRHFDTMAVGHGAVDLEWHGTVASLSIRTFMGVDTGPRITAAFEDITWNGATGLILDLRDNPGGSFAMRHLMGHCISDDTDAGVLLGRTWYAENAHVPDRAHTGALRPWRGSSLVGLWRHLAEQPVTRVQFEPMQPTYGGPIAILINRDTASAAEMVAEVLQHTRRAVLIGERSAGAMLVQQLFDVGDLFTLSLPVADYVSHGNGRIEGLGLVPDITACAGDVHAVALTHLSWSAPTFEDLPNPTGRATPMDVCARPIP
ncbi:MAG: S41 family peptidase [Pseudomonadota bacterium]